jgi:hypothetical protein
VAKPKVKERRRATAATLAKAMMLLQNLIRGAAESGRPAESESSGRGLAETQKSRPTAHPATTTRWTR